MTANIRLYNTLTRTKEPLKPLLRDAAGQEIVRMYVCGPTVYDFAHIGNARPVIVFDVLFRLLRHVYGEKNVIYTRNITDVDDKINDRAARDFPGLPLNEAIRRVTEGTNAQFQADVKALGCLEPTHQPRATEHIEGMKQIIQKLLDKGFAYVAEGGEGREVLFAVQSMPRYGQLSNRRLEEQEAGARVAVEAHKRNPGDFVLWKQSTADQPGWDASFNGVAIFGRPGWHIECSAMSMAKLLEPFGGGLACDDPVKNTFDIHGGGIDLVFPHHENEIAQSCCAFGQPGQPNPLMASIWMHNGFLQVEGQKMSKSLGNFVTIAEVLKDWPGEVARLAMLKTHYRQPIDWTVKSLEESAAEIAGWARLLYGQSGALLSLGRKQHGDTPKPSQEFIKALSDDLNFPSALGWLRSRFADLKKGDQAAAFELAETLDAFGLIDIERLGLFLESVVYTGGQLGPFEADAQFRLLRLALLNHDKKLEAEARRKLASFGVTVDVWADGSFSAVACSPIVEEEYINSLINARLAARVAKNWAESDRIRDELAAMGIQLMDGKDADGNPVTTWEVKR